MVIFHLYKICYPYSICNASICKTRANKSNHNTNSEIWSFRDVVDQPDLVTDRTQYRMNIITIGGGANMPDNPV